MDQLLEFFRELFRADNWPARWHCGRWTDFHGWLYIISDIAIWAAYFVIPLFLLQFIRKKPNIPLPFVFWLFGAFILTCGLTHLLDAVIFWWPAYRLSAFVRFITAIISWITVIAIYKFFPNALSLRTSKDFESELLERRKTESKFIDLLESAPDAMVITNSTGEIQLINAQTEKLFGYSRNEIIGKKVEILIPERFHHNHTHHRNNYVENPKTRAMGIGMNLFGTRKGGIEFPVEVSLSPLKTDDSEEIIVISAIRDITKQKESEAEIKKLNENLEQLVIERTSELQLALENEKAVRIENSKLYTELQSINSELEQRVAKRTHEIEAVNKELEAFSYSVSHDLRAPLRSIDGFSNQILKEYGELFDEKGKDYFMRVKNASRKMGNLIDDLLKLARLSRIEIHPEPTNLSSLAASIIADLQSTNPERTVNIVIQQEMMAMADRNLIQIALQNLLDNAWKYSRNQPNAEIEFGSVLKEDKTIFYIRDNGIGFDMKYIDKLFGAFQRLHDISDFEGTGIGLATVKRVILRHHGTIWAESKVNTGTTFYFTL